MRIFLGLLLLCFSVLLGYCLALKYVKKHELFDEFYAFHKKLLNEISFSQKTLTEIISNDFKIIRIFFENKNEMIIDNLNYISDEEKKFIKEYLSNIGVSDKPTQLAYFNGVEERLKNYFNNSLVEEKKYKPLFVKMGFLIGLILFVMVL